MSLITPSRLLELKEKIKAECARRNKVGSVESYASADYDFEIIPATDQYILEEHYEKLAIPLNAINSTNVPDIDGLGRQVTEDDFINMETWVDTYASRNINSTSPTDCSASCTGTCTTNCTGGCETSCSGTCSGSCSGCSGSCSGSCRGSCKGGCKSGCSGCSGSCEGCSGSCSGSCQHIGCSGSCTSSCVSGCVGTCTTSCGSCTGYCKSSSYSDVYA